MTEISSANSRFFFKKQRAAVWCDAAGGFAANSFPSFRRNTLFFGVSKSGRFRRRYTVRGALGRIPPTKVVPREKNFSRLSIFFEGRDFFAKRA